MLVIGHGTAWLAHHTPSSLLSLRFFSAQLVCPFLCEALSLQISQYLQQEILGADPRLPVSSGHSHSIPAWGCPLSGFSSSSMGHRQSPCPTPGGPREDQQCPSPTPCPPLPGICFPVPGASLVAQRVKQCGRPEFNSWVRKIPWRRKWQPTPVLLPGKPHGWRSLVGYSPWGHKESDTTEPLHFQFPVP